MNYGHIEGVNLGATAWNAALGTAVLLLLAVALPAEAASRYVRSGAAGSGSGADWTNAFTDLPSSLVRGDTYYIADGNYTGYTFDEAASGATVITIKKCTATDHGTDTGYAASYCDGQAVFGTLTINSHYVVIDGSTRNASNWASGSEYGFKADGIYVSTFNTSGNFCPDNVRLRFLNLGTTDSAFFNTNYPDQVMYLGGFQNSCSNWTLEHSYLHNVAHYTMIQAVSMVNSLIQYTQFSNGWGKEAIRGQLNFSGNTIRWNKFHNACGQGGGAGEGCTAEIAAWGEVGNWNDNKIYGNTFYRTRDENSGGTIVIGGNGSTWLGSSASNTLVYNNTIAGIAGSQVGGIILINGGTGNVCRNNLWFDVVGSPSCSANSASNNVEVGSSPFVSYSTGNLRLSGATVAGIAIESPYNVDMNGVTRGADGAWDLGAFEFSSGPTTTPNPPTDVSAN